MAKKSNRKANTMPAVNAATDNGNGERNGPGRKKGSGLDANETRMIAQLAAMKDANEADTEAYRVLLGEYKVYKFKRLGGKRATAAAKAIRALGKLSNKSAYGYTPEDLEKIFGALRTAITATEARFSKAKEAAVDAIVL